MLPWLRKSLFVLLAAGLLQQSVAGATPEFSQEQQVDELAAALKTLKARKLSWNEKAEAMDHLLASDEESCAELCAYLAKQLKGMDTSFHKQWARVEADFTREAAKLAASRLDKKTEARITELRATWLKASRAEGLSKAMVHDICDPAHAELATILDVNLVQVWDADAKLEASWTDLIQLLDDLVYVHDYWRASRAELLAAADSWAKKSFVAKELPDPEGYEGVMLAKLSRAARLATVMPERDRSTFLANEQLFPQLDPEEAAGVLELNRIRVRAGLAAVRLDLKLCDAGRGHSTDMVEHKFFAHESPIPGKKSPSDRAALAGTSGGAENIAAGQRDGHGAIQAWWYSPGHHRNMMGNHSRTGLGRFLDHWTQMFG
jgi:hypothetical protein